MRYLPLHDRPRVAVIGCGHVGSCLSATLADRGLSVVAVDTDARLVDELRRDASESYVRDDGLTLAQIAHLLGYAEQSAFTAAFRRWTGQSPGRFRATELSG